MAPIVLNTLDMPTAAIQGVIAKTKTVLKVFLEKVRATRASPTIYVTHISLLNFEWWSMGILPHCMHPTYMLTSRLELESVQNG